MGGQS
ncbi:phage-related baseplate assembly family protein, partial [Vibrio cholerae HC-77A1]